MILDACDNPLFANDEVGLVEIGMGNEFLEAGIVVEVLKGLGIARDHDAFGAWGQGERLPQGKIGQEGQAVRTDETTIA